VNHSQFPLFTKNPQRASRLSLALLVLVLGCAHALAEDEPRIRLVTPDPEDSDPEVCLESGSAILSVTDGQAFLDANALQNDLGCPAQPGSTPVINSFSFSPDPLDLTANNCDTDGDGTDDAVCVFVSWDITPAIDPTSCNLSQTQPAKDSMTPFEIDNPGDNGGDCCDFAEFDGTVENLAWPVNQQTATVGDKTFLMECRPTDSAGNPITASRTVNFTDGSSPTVVIDSFDIQQSVAQQGDTIDFSFNTTLQNNPSAPTCTLVSDTDGVINDVGPIQVDGSQQSSTATILADAPTGSQSFTFSCRPDSMTPATDQATDSVTIEAGSGSTVDCSNFPPPPGTSRDTSMATTWNEVFSFWPGGSGNTETINVRNGQYMALEFTANSESVTFGGYTWGKPTSGLGPQANAVVSYSQCAGDFNPDIQGDGQQDPECVFAALNGSVQWQLPPAEVGSCQLEPGTTYFLNIIFGEAGSPATSSCPSGETWCSHLGGVQ